MQGLVATYTMDGHLHVWDITSRIMSSTRYIIKLGLSNHALILKFMHSWNSEPSMSWATFARHPAAWEE